MARFLETSRAQAGPDTDRLAVLLCLLSAGHHPPASLVRRLGDAGFFPSADRSAGPMDLRMDADMLGGSLRVRTSTRGGQGLSDLVRESRHGLTLRSAQHRLGTEMASSAWAGSMESFPAPSPDVRTDDAVEQTVRDGFSHVLGSVRADW